MSDRRSHFDAGVAANDLATGGGFSRKPKSGRQARRGYMVSEHGAEEVVPGLAGADDIEAYKEARGDSLSQPGKYLGGWVDSGQTYLDESRRHLDRRQAMDAGIRNAQLGVYDIHKDRSINPFGAGIKYRGTLFEHASRNERRRVSSSNAALRQSEARKALDAGQATTNETDDRLKHGDKIGDPNKVEQPKQLTLKLRRKRVH